jgi:hypothetical protein
MVRLIALFACVALVGCGKKPEGDVNWLHSKVAISESIDPPRHTMEPQLPSRAFDIKDVGNGWVTFQLHVEGKGICTFLFTRYRTSYGYGVGVITQVQ